MSYDGIQTFRANCVGETNGGVTLDDDNLQSWVMGAIHREATEEFDRSFITQVSMKLMSYLMVCACSSDN